MSCNKCASENGRTFKAELVLNFHEVEDLGRGPVYVCEDIAVCLDWAFRTYGSTEGVGR
jgi:hypothetical protein